MVQYPDKWNPDNFPTTRDKRIEDLDGNDESWEAHGGSVKALRSISGWNQADDSFDSGSLYFTCDDTASTEFPGFRPSFPDHWLAWLESTRFAPPLLPPENPHEKKYRWEHYLPFCDSEQRQVEPMRPPSEQDWPSLVDAQLRWHCEKETVFQANACRIIDPTLRRPCKVLSLEPSSFGPTMKVTFPSDVPLNNYLDVMPTAKCDGDYFQAVKWSQCRFGEETLKLDDPEWQSHHDIEDLGTIVCEKTEEYTLPDYQQYEYEKRQFEDPEYHKLNHQLKTMHDQACWAVAICNKPVTIHV